MFYPIEDETELATLRSLISPFMTNIKKCFSPEYLFTQEREQICDDVINSSSPAVNPALLTYLNQVIAHPENRTLGLEQGALRQISLRFIPISEKKSHSF